MTPIHEYDSQLRDTLPGSLPRKPTSHDLELSTVLPAPHIQAITNARKLVFHVNGDMGGINDSTPQTLVAKGMEADFNHRLPPADNPAFLYLLGDCVYFNGEIKQYYAQFYHPYEFYPAPIFAVPGNHDGENLAGDSSLDGFVRNFCAPAPVKLPESGDSQRTAMVQPNVYWTLLTPLANLVGLYSNVPEGGAIRDDQAAWLVDQLRTLPTDRPLFLSYTIRSIPLTITTLGVHMKQVLSKRSSAGRHPEMIFAGHMHNYQRLTKVRLMGHKFRILLPAPRYHNLHHVKKWMAKLW
jgi:hypothetical protein